VATRGRDGGLAKELVEQVHWDKDSPSEVECGELPSCHQVVGVGGRDTEDLGGLGNGEAKMVGRRVKESAFPSRRCPVPSDWSLWHRSGEPLALGWLAGDQMARGVAVLSGWLFRAKPMTRW
jgi:hypothetical protein